MIHQVTPLAIRLRCRHVVHYRYPHLVTTFPAPRIVIHRVPHPHVTPHLARHQGLLDPDADSNHRGLRIV